MRLFHTSSNLLSRTKEAMSSSRQRDRVPLSGRSNLSSSRVVINTARSGDSVPDSTRSLSSEEKQRLNDPLEVFRPYSPEIQKAEAHLVRPPMLPPSRYPTVLPAEKPRRRHPPTCPEGWVEKNLAPNWFETVDQKTAVLEVESKTKFCREFVERNRDRMWKFDLAYLGRTPRSICDDMLDRPNFIKNISNMHSRERALNLSSSEKLQKCLRDDHLQSLGEVTSDPYLQSFKTPREARMDSMTRILQPAMLQHGTKYQRGYKHAPEYGNFR